MPRRSGRLRSGAAGVTVGLLAACSGAQAIEARADARPVKQCFDDEALPPATPLEIGRTEAINFKQFGFQIRRAAQLAMDRGAAVYEEFIAGSEAGLPGSQKVDDAREIGAADVLCLRGGETFLSSQGELMISTIEAGDIQFDPSPEPFQPFFVDLRK